MTGYVCDTTTQTCLIAQDASTENGDVAKDTPEQLDPDNLPTHVTAGNGHTCVRFEDGTIRCWGGSTLGQLGYARTLAVGDDELPITMPVVDVGAKVLTVQAGFGHTCALLEPADVRCWGFNEDGRLGLGHDMTIGDDEVPSAIAPVVLGENVIQSIATGGHHVCVKYADGQVRCWGNNDYGQLGYAMTDWIGDDEAPLTVGLVQVGAAVIDIAAAFEHTCALFEGGDVRCWGKGNHGQLGYGNTADIGDNELPLHVPLVDVGGKVIQIDGGSDHTCVLLQSGLVRCWGSNGSGQLGYGHTEDIGDDEPPSSVGPISLGGKAVQISVGGNHACALLESGDVRCWGANTWGALGYGHTQAIGDDELPSSVSPVSVGGKVDYVSAGGSHTCALLEGGAIRCWGANFEGGLGYGHTRAIGDDELPSSVAPVQVQ